jgi:hypothetical protein
MTETQGPRLSGPTKLLMLTAVFVIGLIVAVAMIGGGAPKPTLTGDVISRTFSAGEPCATASIPITVPQGTEPTKVAETIFGALESAKGMNTASYNVKTSVLEAGFCESKSSEKAVREALAPTGLLAD